MDTARDCTRRVVVTGLGVISPIGNNQEAFWQSLIDGRNGISRLNCSPQNGFPDACAGEAREFAGRIEDFCGLDKEVKKAIRKALKVMNRETRMAVAAAQQAIADSDLPAAGLEPERIGVCFGTGFVSMMPEDFQSGIDNCTDSGREEFDFSRWGTEGVEQVTPLWLLTCLPNMPACHIAIYNDLRGPNNSITQREAAANLAVAEAYYAIADGAADAIVVGATGTTLLPFNLLHTLMEQDVAPGGSDPAKVCRPFDRDRSGSVVGEGAAALILEEMHSAIRRGADIYGEVAGAGSSCVVERNHVPRCSAAAANAIRAALRSAGLSPDDVGHVHAHGMSTYRSDIEEAQAIREVFGSRADELPVVAAKSYVGNAGAGGGAIELVASLLALKHGRLFPVLNYENPDPQCPIAPVTSSDVEAGDSFLNLSMVPQGQASCVLITAFQ